MGETSVTDSATGDAAGGTGPATSSDGRLTRAARTRTAVVDALLTLNERGELRPTARDIATEAGVSLRSVYVHFDDLEALFVESSRRHHELLMATLPPIVDEGTFDVRLDAFLLRRVAINEFAPGVRRAALLQEPFSPVLQQVMALGRQALRAEVGTSFAPELAAVEGDEMPLLRAIDLVTNATTWDSLRSVHHLSVDDATDHVRAMIVAFVRAWSPAALAADRHPSDASDAPGEPATHATTAEPGR